MNNKQNENVNEEAIPSDNKDVHQKDNANNEKDLSIEEPKKKKRRKGQNSRRSATVPKVGFAFRICPNILKSEHCKYGETCRYLHDVETYMKNKPEDLGTECINYKLTGKCKYGIECRYAKEHVSEDFKNIVDEEKYKQYCEKSNTDNTLIGDTGFSLRKRQYKFPRTEVYLSKLNSEVVSRNSNVNKNRECTFVLILKKGAFQQ